MLNRNLLIKVLAVLMLFPSLATAEIGPALSGLTGSANDATSVFYSPAGITRLDQPEIVFQSAFMINFPAASGRGINAFHVFKRDEPRGIKPQRIKKIKKLLQSINFPDSMQLARGISRDRDGCREEDIFNKFRSRILHFERVKTKEHPEYFEDSNVDLIGACS